MRKHAVFFVFPAHAKNGPRWPQMGPGGFFPTNPDLADILGRTDFDFENFHFWDPKFPDFQVPDFQISRDLAWAHPRAHPRGPPEPGPARPKAQARPRPDFWKSGNLGTWKSRNLESKKSTKKNMRVLKIQIRSAQKVGKVWISRKNILLALFGTI